MWRGCQTHPHPRATHVVLDVHQYPQLFRMLNDADSIGYDESLGGFAMTREAYQNLKGRLQNANSMPQAMAGRGPCID